MSITQLHYIVALARHQHFRKAARACHITQPTLSLQIQRFEEQLGTILFDRSASPIYPTQEGEAIIEQAKRAIDAYDAVFSIADQWKGQLSGTFRLAMIPTIAPYLLPQWLPQFARQFPHVNIEISELQTSHILDQLEDGDLDAAILATPLKAPRLRTRTLYYEPFVAYLSKACSPPKKGPVTIDKLDKDRLLLLQEGHCLSDQALRLCNLRSRPKIANFNVISLETLRGVVHACNGWTLLPKLAADQLPKSEKTALYPLDNDAPVREISLIFRRSGRHKGILDALEKVIRSAIAPEMQRPSKKHKILNPKPVRLGGQI